MQTTDVYSARSVIDDVRQRAVARGIHLRQPPPEPTTCCGRGCNGCVWEGYFGAVHYWLEDAQAALGGGAGSPADGAAPVES